MGIKQEDALAKIEPRVLLTNLKLFSLHAQAINVKTVTSVQAKELLWILFLNAIP